jgi:hypothetical protein
VIYVTDHEYNCIRRVQLHSSILIQHLRSLSSTTSSSSLTLSSTASGDNNSNEVQSNVTPSFSFPPGILPIIVDYIPPLGIVSTITKPSKIGSRVDGNAETARFNRPHGIAIDGSGGSLIVMDDTDYSQYYSSGKGSSQPIRRISMMDGSPLASLIRPPRDWK